MELKPTEKKQVKVKMALTGMSGSGKSLSSLLLAKGLCNGDLSKVAVIDTENAISLYSQVGNFNVLNMTAPFTVDKYITAIDICEKAGMECIILDGISQEWQHLLQYHGTLMGNSFTAWQKVTPLHTAFVQRILQSPCHILATMRAKTNLLMEVKDNKTTIVNAGTKSIQRSDIVFEFSTVLSINAEHKASCIKDRSGLFTGKPAFVITENIGKQILDWCNCEIPKSTTIVGMKAA